MLRTSILLFFLLIGIGAILLTMNSCGVDPGNHILAGKFQHVVIIFQENRTPDNLFHDPALIKAGADIAINGVNSKGQSVPLQSAPLATTYDMNHSHMAFTQMYNNGKMNGAGICSGLGCPSPQAYIEYVRESDVQPYFRMAEQYAFGDRMFQTNQGPSFPAHQFIISGSSAPTASSASFLAENPENTAVPRAGCIAPPGESVGVIDAKGRESLMFPCTEHPTLTDELNKEVISWKYYTPSAGSIWTAPNAIEHMCGPNASPPHATACVGSDWKQHVVLYSKQNPAPILTDIANSQLPAVSWVIPAGQNSDHAGGSYAEPNNGGPSWVASIVNAIGNSQYWANTAIVVTWDDWGGWYDHVPPFKMVNDGVSWGSGYVYGFRVPLIVISPYARPSYISHVNHDFGSILHMVEENFGLPSLGYADSYADDLSDCFNFHQQPLAFQTIDAPLKADHFLHDTTPPTDPDDD
ncbi:MAG: alkaline phosphatase family protein [Candidatus Sulfotelmatobacter sp.]